MGGTNVKFEFGGKTAIVSGGASGIGLAVAEALLGAGANVAVLDRNEAAVRALELGPGKAGGRGRGELAAAVCDLTDAGGVSRELEKIVGRFGAPHYLVNSVGVNIRKPALELETPELELMFHTNFFAVFNLCRAAARLMRDARGAGELQFRKIVNIASTGAWQGSKNYAGYNATKAALVTATKVLANEWIEHGIIVNAVCPGPTLTPFVKSHYAEHPELVASIIGRTPAGRIADPADHAGAVLFLLSDASDWIVGHAVVSDGGKGLNG